MQFNRFVNGGYVLHKITGQWKGRCSAWFGRDGNLLDAEQILGTVSRNVRRNGPMWNELHRIGQRYKHVPAMPV